MPWTFTPQGRCGKRCFGRFWLGLGLFFILECDVLYCGVIFLNCCGGFCDPCECDIECGAVDLVEVFERAIESVDAEEEHVLCVNRMGYPALVDSFWPC